MNIIMDELRDVSTVKEVFAGLVNVDVRNAIFCCLPGSTRNKNTLMVSLLRIICYSFMIDVSFKKENNAEIAFIYSNSYKNRSDHYEIMSEFVKAFESRIFFYPGRKKFYPQNLAYIKNLRNWYSNFRKDYSIKDSIFLVSMLLFGITNCDYILKTIVDIRTNKIVVFSDMHLIDSLIVQKCNNIGLTTFTLQHGNFETEIPYLLSKSKYFLAYGEYTKRKAVSFGMDSNKVIPAGVLRGITKKFPDTLSYKNQIKNIGIIMSGFADKNADEAMVNLLISYANDHDLKLFVKFHPGYGIDNYTGIDWNRIEKTFSSEINVNEFSELVDIAIIYNSTVFVEYVLSLFPTFLFVYNEDKYFLDINWCKFSNIEQLDYLISDLLKNPSFVEQKLLETRKYFSASENISDNYKKIISTLN